jgi:hypothetical protein
MSEAEQEGRERRRFVKDARGKKVTQLDPVGMYLLRQHDVIEPDVLRAIAQEEGLKVTPKERAALIIGLAGALLVIVLYTHAFFTGDLRDATYAKTSSLLFLCAIPLVAWYRMRRARFGQVAAAMLKHLRCPHCGYDLRMLPADPADGATTCPECGCAWRLGPANTE